jgi:diaminohydroxyphosphoribosylaminopyrimidine deaminase/5-amino-6-(5-phosphoribosylamino)uracil reductase
VVLTGIGTVRADNPKMTVRHVVTPRQPKRAVIDPGFEIAEDAAVLEGGDAFVFVGDSNPEKAARLAARGVQVVCVPEAAAPPAGQTRRRIDMRAMMQWLAAQGHNEVHCEAGSGLNGALLDAGCVDELLVYMAPMLLGEGRSMAQLPVLTQLEGAKRFEFIEVKQLGTDIRVRARLPERWRELMQSIHLIESNTDKVQ